MSEEAYRRLAEVLDTLPSGFPSTQSGIEIRILEKIFEPEEAELFCDLRLTPETAARISERTGRPLEGLEQKLMSMSKRGELWASELDGVWKFKIMPWIPGIYEFQVKQMDQEFATMWEEYSTHWGKQFVRHKPQLMQVVPIEKEIPVKQEALIYQQVSGLLEKAGSFFLNECMCKKRRGLLGNTCSKPTEVCLALDVPEAMNVAFGGKAITREEAYEVLRKSEEAGLVHLTNNLESGHWFLCNCCGCCCGVLRTVNRGAHNSINSHYYAEIDPELCVACGVCADERCQVKAIEKGDEFYSILKEKCIGCGLCASTCAEEAITMVHKKTEDRSRPPKNEDVWLEERGHQRGVDFSIFK